MTYVFETMRTLQPGTILIKEERPNLNTQIALNGIAKLLHQFIHTSEFKVIF